MTDFWILQICPGSLSTLLYLESLCLLYSLPKLKSEFLSHSLDKLALQGVSVRRPTLVRRSYCGCDRKQ